MQSRYSFSLCTYIVNTIPRVTRSEFGTALVHCVLLVSPQPWRPKGRRSYCSLHLNAMSDSNADNTKELNKKAMADLRSQMQNDDAPSPSKRSKVAAALAGEADVAAKRDEIKTDMQAPAL